MKVYLSTDLEGISGVDSMDMIPKDSPRHREALEHLMEDINAAVDGAFAGGATHVAVRDGHGGGGNFIVEMLDKRAEHDTGKSGKRLLDNTYDATFFIGAHAMAGTINGFLDHTQSSLAWYNYSINGRRMGEIGQCAIWAGNHGVPLVMVTGDEAACVEARQFLYPVETAMVKRGIGRNRAELVELGEARNRIREAARRAMSIAKDARPYIPSTPMEIRLEFTRSDYCDAAVARGAERIDARTVRKYTNDTTSILI